MSNYRRNLIICKKIKSETNEVFSVSANKKVKFSKGNLYYSTTDSKYHIENQQNVTYITLGQSTYDATHICHFYWSNIADWHTPGKQPWAKTYSYDIVSTDDKFFCGIDNPMEVDGYSGLYTLTSGEWGYLFSGRTNASILYKKDVSVTTSAGTVANCIVIAPDDWDYVKNPLQDSYDASAWAVVEARGAICLPAAGVREGSSLSCDNGFGCYWSSSPYSQWTAFDIQFWNNHFNYENRNYRDGGYSVRLVMNI